MPICNKHCGGKAAWPASSQKRTTEQRKGKASMCVYVYAHGRIGGGRMPLLCKSLVRVNISSTFPSHSSHSNTVTICIGWMFSLHNTCTIVHSNRTPCLPRPFEYKTDRCVSPVLCVFDSPDGGYPIRNQVLVGVSNPLFLSLAGHVLRAHTNRRVWRRIAFDPHRSSYSSLLLTSCNEVPACSDFPIEHVFFV